MRRFFLSHLIHIPIDYLRQLTNTLFPGKNDFLRD